ncbi:hypothetical protein YH65_08055 [Sulfurovum lithotrophicum]|uniref:Uncharacterized protein n=1 Tax=Sulfurovum lithotrophicum TaxID=206403 RepID=A0A7U4M1W9_9BACT|nr:hypothetical protein [Sulfurovum lithotrophicum]AKF25345.1 hypothetical protein YH65_08055 [Sulfurovum lithotrophicum]
MDRCKEIIANVRKEERYTGMSLVFGVNREDLKEEINAAIEKTSRITGLEPLVFDNADTDKTHHEAFYIEFHDDVLQRESGEFIEILLKELKIDKCSNDVIEN